MERLSRFETLLVVSDFGCRGRLSETHKFMGLSDPVDFGGWLHLCRRVSVRGIGAQLIGIAHVLWKVAIVAIVGYVVYLPFHANFELFTMGLSLASSRHALWRFF